MDKEHQGIAVIVNYRRIRDDNLLVAERAKFYFKNNERSDPPLSIVVPFWHHHSRPSRIATDPAQNMKKFFLFLATVAMLATSSKSQSLYPTDTIANFFHPNQNTHHSNTSKIAPIGA